MKSPKPIRFLNRKKESCKIIACMLVIYLVDTKKITMQSNSNVISWLKWFACLADDALNFEKWTKINTKLIIYSVWQATNNQFVDNKEKTTSLISFEWRHFFCRASCKAPNTQCTMTAYHLCSCRTNFPTLIQNVNFYYCSKTVFLNVLHCFSLVCMHVL